MKKNLKRGLAAAAALLFVLPLLAALPASAADTLTVENCTSAYLYNFENDRALFEYRANERAFPASTVKLMTALVVCDAFGDALDTPVTVTWDMLSEVAGNSVEFFEGEVVTVRQLLNCMLVNSANDAAIILAYAVAGSTSAFVARMNEKAEALGMANTTYTNCTGMHDPKMITTAADTARAAKALYAIPGVIDITSQQKYVMPATNMSAERVVFNRNGLISKYYTTGYYYPAAIGMNAGATEQGGYSLCAAAREEDTGLTYLAVVLGGLESDGKLWHYENGRRMFDWAFSAYSYRPVLSTTQVICEIPVRLSSTVDYVTLVPKETVTVYLPVAMDIDKEVIYSYNTFEDEMDAPIEAGEEAGVITVVYGDEIIGTCPLVTTVSVTRSEFLYFLKQIESFTKSRFFFGTVIAVVVLTLIYVFAQAAFREKRIRKMSGRGMDRRRQR